MIEENGKLNPTLKYQLIIQEGMTELGKNDRNHSNKWLREESKWILILSNPTAATVTIVTMFAK